ncbi:16S rRNA (guanine(966)-N(2))-methyltransferase RsmD [Fundidesulfovibrio agrisoli]|uniref:16S rRNA (guanine(966)-N(2))-methyltransferase RsmD n=1 Tax=Fundidesulfovibrio agrisoli TaxID=2922717 RepID=UPI001FAB6342|nr:16S rRNA (guanine(966)-N(2))-methyltransferase RsmD [Fundidesulfovibrio agrisoli]
MRILGGNFKGRNLPTLEAKGCRPAMAVVREALFNIIAARGLALSGARVIDVFAGTGSLGFECLSRGAAFVQFVEANRALAKRLADNARLLGLEASRIAAAPADALKLLARPPRIPFDLAFVDPPYGQELLAPVMNLLAAKRWLADGALVVAEVEKHLEYDGWPASLALEADRQYGQTRILIWTHQIPAQRSTPEPSTP